MPVPCPRLCLAVLMVAAAAASAGAADADAALWWVADDGRPLWRVPLEIPTPSTGADLLAETWFPPIPDVRVPLLEGGDFSIASARGNVLLIDFWASWCTPCLAELPQLQKLYEAEKDRGLAAIAINSQERITTVHAAVEAMGLTLPIGKYDSAVDEAFKVRSLPTVILVDRQGRVRARWDGYAPGLEKTIARQTRDLLEDDPAGAARAIARIHEGEGRAEVLWSRDTPVPLEGLLVVPAADVRARIVGIGRGQLLAIAPDGDLIGRHPAPAAAGRVALANGGDGGRRKIVAFRPAGTTLAVFDSATAASALWDAPAKLLDVAVVASPDDGAPDLLYMATLEGLFRAGLDGESLTRFGDDSLVNAVVAAGPEGDAGVFVLRRGTVESVALDGEVSGGVRVGDAAWALVAPPRGHDGLGVTPREVTASTAVEVAPGQAAIALATDGDQLLVVDPATGRTVLRAGWPGIGVLAAGDLDGDGREEILVAAKRSLTAVRLLDEPSPSDPRNMQSMQGIGSNRSTKSTNSTD